MRHLRSIKRRDTYILNVLFLASIFLFYQTHADIFFKEFTERQLEKALPEGARVEISGIKGGIFKNLISRDTRILPLLEGIQDTSRIHITRDRGSVDLEIERKINRFEIIGRANHINPARWFLSNGVKFHDMDFIGEVSASIDGNRPGFIDATLAFKNVIINFSPFYETIEIFLSYDRAKDTLNVNKFKIGDEIEGYGYVRLAEPHYVFLKWTITNLDLENYSAFHDGKNNIQGTMFGAFTVKGPIKEPFLAGRLDVQNGSWGDFKFDSFIARLKGKLPLVSICDSRIWKEDGYMILDGEIDLAKLKDGKVFDGVSLEPGENFFVWEEWSVMKKSGDSSVKAEKSLDEEFDLTFKAYKKDEESEEGHFLGVEHKVKF